MFPSSLERPNELDELYSSSKEGQKPPFITCLCPTYGRPKLLANAIECFLRQDYPRERRALLIYDDLGTVQTLCVPEHERESICLDGRVSRFPSLPEKYNAMWRDGFCNPITGPQTDIFVVWEDDDAQLPWCLSSVAKSMPQGGWTHPSYVWSDYGNQLHTEPVGGRFHGALGISAELMRQIDGWPVSKRADFDMQFIAHLRENGPCGDPCEHSPLFEMNHQTARIPVHSPVIYKEIGMPPYCFRWHTEHNHGQSVMRGPDDESWYDNYVPDDPTGPHTIIPALDNSARRILKTLKP